MSAPEPWRRTGRKAANDHWLGLERLTLIEVSLYDDGGRQQGRGLIQLQERGTEVQPGEGQTWLSRFVGVEDGYYEWWVNTTFPTKVVPLHFCQRQAHHCSDTTVYRDPIHVDVFRILPGRSYESLNWLKGVKRDEAEKLIDFSNIVVPGGGGAGSGVPGDGNPPPGPREDVQTGAEGIDGLAAALGSQGGAAPGGDRPVAKADARGGERPREEKEEKGASPKASGLQGVIAQRVAPEPADSALKIRKANASKKKKKDKKRAKRQAEKERKRARKGEERKADDSSDESSSTTSSSSDSLFRLAALPQGTDRLHRLHQERPGVLANLTLRRFQELLERSTGGGTAVKDQEMPPVARAYLS